VRAGEKSSKKLFCYFNLKCFDEIESKMRGRSQMTSHIS